MTGEVWVDFKGVRFTEPFICMCCGTEVEVRQWAYGRMCGLCDTGVCQSSKSHRLEWAHEDPEWRPHAMDGKAFERFVEAVGASNE